MSKSVPVRAPVRAPIRALLIDLDDTLYAEISYVESGIGTIAGILARHCDYSAGHIEHYMRYDFMKFGRSGMFDRALAHFKIEGADIAELVEAYRQHEPDIEFYPGVADSLAKLRKNFKLAIVTDGLGVMQRAKVAALDLALLVDETVYCWDLEAKKPDPRGFLQAAERLGVAAAETMIVGDDPYHDVEAAKRGGFQICRVRTGRFAALDDLENPDNLLEISDFTKLPQLLAKIVS